MSALGLAGYSSSDAEDENTRVDVHESTKAGLENTSVADNPRDAHVQASKQIAPGIFSSFGRSKRKGKHSRGGLPLFSTPVGADNGSDSDDDLVRTSPLSSLYHATVCFRINEMPNVFENVQGQRYKRLRPDTVAEGRLSFLPKPVHALPIHEEDQAPKLELAASQPDIVSFVDTSEMYRVDGRTSPAASIAMDSTYALTLQYRALTHLGLGSAGLRCMCVSHH